MQEFSSISVSSYEAETLSDRLTEQSASGWSVVAVVPAGSQVVAYLSREASGDSAPAATVSSDSTPDFGDVAVADVTPDVAVDQPVVADPVADASGWAVTPDAASTVDTTTSPDPEPVIAAVVTPEVATPAAAAAAAPAGWYADPSARYDLRYWDGSDWTEHVSRNGQQSTDPPVA